MEEKMIMFYCNMTFQYLYSCVWNTADFTILSTVASVSQASKNKIIPGNTSHKSTFN